MKRNKIDELMILEVLSPQNTIEQTNYSEIECDICSNNIEHGKTLEQHINEHHKVIRSDYFCNVCGLICMNNDFLNKHAKSHADSLTTEWFTISCVYCKESFNNQSVLRSHIYKYHIGQFLLNCTSCDNRSINISAFANHFKTHNKNKCEKCHTIYIFEYDYNLHMKACGKNSITSEQITPQVTNSKCQLCNFQFNSGRELKDHVRLPHIDSCDQCKLKFTLYGDLIQHINVVHEGHDNILEELSEHIYKCLECNSIFNSKKELDDHILLPHSHGCFSCNLKFVSKGELNSHINKLHNKTQKNNCKICNVPVTSMESLDKHIILLHVSPVVQSNNLFARDSKSHYTSKLCAFSADNITDMRYHLYSNHKICPVCDKKIDNLASHVESHVKCDSCKLLFKDVNGLSLHKLANHTVNNFKCNLCNDSFKDVNVLNLHKHVAHNNKLNLHKLGNNNNNNNNNNNVIKELSKSIYKCLECNFIFNTGKEFNDHILLPHNYGCINCNLKFTLHEQLNSHSNETHNKNSIIHNTFHCKICNNALTSSESLDKHIIVMHTSPGMRNESKFTYDNSIYKCDLCNFSVGMMGIMICHMYTDHKICPICNDIVGDGVSFMSHVESDHIQCTLCKILYKDIDELNEHKRLNHNMLVIPSENPRTIEKDLIIKIPKNIMQNALEKEVLIPESTPELLIIDLEESELSTTKEIPKVITIDLNESESMDVVPALKEPNKVIKRKGKYVCKDCKKSFRLSVLYDKHCFHEHTVHDKFLENAYTYDKKEKLFNCKICNKKFNRLPDIKWHVHINHKEDKINEIKCEKCNEVFQDKLFLYSHMRAMHKDDNSDKFKCPSCDKSFSYKILLLQHINDKHKT